MDKERKMGKGRKMVQIKKPKGAKGMPDMSAIGDMMSNMGGLGGMPGMPGMSGPGQSGGMPDMASMMQMMQGMGMGNGGDGGMGMPGMPGGGQMPDLGSMMNMMKGMGMDPAALMGGGGGGNGGSDAMGGFDPMALAALMPPPKQDKATKYGHVNAGDFSSWVMIYPVYLNQTKTLAEGRRISKEKAVIDPTLEDLQEACNLLRLKFIVEPYKQYPREWTPSGRIRVEIKNSETGSKIHRDISSRKDLYEKISSKIPLLQSRKNRLKARNGV